MNEDLIKRFLAKVSPEPNSGCWIWDGPRKGHGYGFLTVLAGTPSGKTTVYAHRISWELRNGPVPDGMEVCHRCDNPWCVNPDHLWIGAHSENMADMMAKGRRRQGKAYRGEANPGAKLTRDQAIFIRASIGKIPQRELARQLGVSRAAVKSVQQRKSWRWT